MNSQEVIGALILCCLGGTAVNSLAQSRPLRQTQHHSATSAKAAQQQAVAAAQAQARQAQEQAQQALDQAEIASQAAAQAQAAAAQVQGAPAQAQAQAAQAAQQQALQAQNQADAASQAASAAAAKARAAAQAAQAAQAQTEGAPAKKSLCWLAPASHCYSSVDTINGVNDFYGMAHGYTYLSQVKSIYNGASGATTVSADLASLNFPAGPQLELGTNIQAGATAPSTVTAGSTPTLVSTSAAQATQNMIFGGTFDSALLFPIVYHGLVDANSAGGVIFSMDAIGRGGVDIQNFKSGTSTTVDNPPTHANVGLESYLQFNSANLAEGTSGILGDVFVGGRYGYNYASHGYARDYGFGNRVNSGVGQCLIGVMLSKLATISISRGFGPSQVYIDSTSGSMTAVNHFKAWSFGITYQAPSTAPTSVQPDTKPANNPPGT